MINLLKVDNKQGIFFLLAPWQLFYPVTIGTNKHNKKVMHTDRRKDCGANWIYLTEITTNLPMTSTSKNKYVK